MLEISKMLWMTVQCTTRRCERSWFNYNCSCRSSSLHTWLICPSLSFRHAAYVLWQ